ncbi:hypothetical protein RN001_002117 [Aquatica leii]|uniref:Uncharacterized protein n=1 Tax=Aquatica leii TaxID=1421715 RepID=A0AAN7PPG3_9COLE|nr:hypothetical protein RN001_002117 [Aquatica leii]
MKILLVFFVCFGAFPVEVIQTVQDECIKESYVNHTLVERLLQLHDFIDDENLKCFQLCVFVKVNAMTRKGDVSSDLIMSELPVGDTLPIEYIVNKCQSVKGKYACETAHLLWKCIVRFSV